jgi:serine/threonine-protein kinase
MPRLGVRLDDTARDFLEGAALARRTVRIPVLHAPVQGTLYVLEVTSPRTSEALVLLARSVGPEAPTGWPFALARLEETEVDGEGSDPLYGRDLAGGKLVLAKRIGEGGSGIVYQARHRGLRLDVAVKLLHADLQRDAEFVRRFEAEALLASRLDHPNITRVLDFGQEKDGLLYLAMEYLDGKSLRDELGREGRLPLTRVVPILSQLCAGLTHAHVRGLVHRDVKPENVVLTRGLDDDGHAIEVVKLCDFGIALVHESAAQAGESSGTPDYMAPEQILGEPPDPRNDVYACGVLLYELLSGEVPFPGELQDLVARKRAGVYEPLGNRVRGLDPRVERIVARALAVDKNERFASARDLRSALAPPAPASVRTSQPEWLESGRDHLLASVPPPAASMPPASYPRGSMPPPASYARASMPPPTLSFPPAPASGSIPPTPPSSSRDLSPTGDGEARTLALFLRRLADAREPDAFAHLASELDPQVRALVAQGHAQAAWRLRSTLDVIAAEPAGEGGRGRAADARRLLKIFYDVKLLKTIAAKALDGIEDRDRTAAKLIVRAGLHGAHAVYGARLENGVFDARERFVAILEEIGPTALDLYRAALGKLESQLHMPGAATVVEDLFRAMPEMPSPALAELVARYARMDHAKVAPLAASAVARIAGPAGRPVLLELVVVVRDEVALAALAGLRKTGGMDALAVQAVAPILSGQLEVKPRVRVAVAEALASACADGVLPAQKLCQWVLSSVEASTPEVEDLVVVAAKSLVTLGGDGAYVAERWKRSASWLRTRLEAVLRELPR